MTDSTAPTPADSTARSDARSPLNFHVLAWAFLALVFVGYVLFGTGYARVWTFGTMTIESMSVRNIWSHWLTDLPDMPGQGWWDVLIYFSLFGVILWSVVGLAMFLMPSWFEQYAETDDTLQAVTAPAMDEAPVVESESLADHADAVPTSRAAHDA